METYTKKLFCEICERGLIIEVGKGCPVEHLPKCLISVNNDLPSFEFRINSIIPNGKSVHFVKILNEFGKVYAYIINIIGYMLSQPDDAAIYFYHRESFGIKKLDFLTNYVYRYNIEFDRIDLYAEPDENTINNYKKNLKIKMIQDMIELYMLKFMYFSSGILSIMEIKIVIIEKLIKLDNWYDLEIV